MRLKTKLFLSSFIALAVMAWYRAEIEIMPDIPEQEVCTVEVQNKMSEQYSFDETEEIEENVITVDMSSMSDNKQRVWEVQDETDKYYLAKIAECEGRNQSIECRAKIIMVVLNRLESDKYPDTILEVITQNNGKTWQFSPCMPGGTWYSDNWEPTEESYEALELVLELSEDTSNGVMFFEAVKSSSWHSRNLEYICTIDDTNFYR